MCCVSCVLVFYLITRVHCCRTCWAKGASPSSAWQIPKVSKILFQHLCSCFGGGGASHMDPWVLEVRIHHYYPIMTQEANSIVCVTCSKVSLVASTGEWQAGSGTQHRKCTVDWFFQCPAQFSTNRQQTLPTALSSASKVSKVQQVQRLIL